MKYSLAIILLSLTICLNSGFSQIVYTDIEPDTILIGSQSSKYLDIDGDNINDFALFHDTVFTAWPNDSGMVNGIAHFNGNEILCVIDGHMYPNSLYYNYTVDIGAQVWANYENNVPLFVYAMVNGEYQNWGYFQKMTTDRFIGIKMNNGAGTFFGWIRIYIHPSGSYLVCRDFAYNSLPNAEIYAGEGIPTGKTNNVVAIDDSDFGDGRDIKLTFSKAENEFTVFQYRAFVVKAEDTSTFDIVKALAVPVGNCLGIPPNGSDRNLNLKENSKDIDGDLIVQNTEYVLFVVSCPRGTRAEDYQISSSDPFVLLNTIGINEADNLSEYYFYSNNSCYLNGNSNGVDFVIYDLSGKIVAKYAEVKDSRGISGLTKGIYIMAIHDKGTIRQAKFIILE